VTQVSARTSRANLTTLAVQATAFANAVDDFKTATNSKWQAERKENAMLALVDPGAMPMLVLGR